VATAARSVRSCARSVRCAHVLSLGKPRVASASDVGRAARRCRRSISSLRPVSSDLTQKLLPKEWGRESPSGEERVAPDAGPPALERPFESAGRCWPMPIRGEPRCRPRTCTAQGDQRPADGLRGGARRVEQVLDPAGRRHRVPAAPMPSARRRARIALDVEDLRFASIHDRGPRIGDGRAARVRSRRSSHSRRAGLSDQRRDALPSGVPRDACRTFARRRVCEPRHKASDESLLALGAACRQERPADALEIAPRIPRGSSPQRRDRVRRGLPPDRHPQWARPEGVPSWKRAGCAIWQPRPSFRRRSGSLLQRLRPVRLH
jgi:hypothetical protein